MHITTEMIMTQCQYIIYTVDFKGDLRGTDLIPLMWSAFWLISCITRRSGVAICLLLMHVSCHCWYMQFFCWPKTFSWLTSPISDLNKLLAGPPMKLKTSHSMWATWVTRTLLLRWILFKKKKKWCALETYIYFSVHFSSHFHSLFFSFALDLKQIFQTYTWDHTSAQFLWICMLSGGPVKLIKPNRANTASQNPKL